MYMYLKRAHLVRKLQEEVFSEPYPSRRLALVGLRRYQGASSAS